MKDLKPTLKYPILLTLIGMLLIQIPIVSMFVLIPLLPTTGLLDLVVPGDFSTTGENVEIGFAWITFKTWQAWIFYAAQFIFIGCFFGYLKERRTKIRTTTR